MIIGCFALVEPFTAMDRQFKLIKEMGFDYADLTDNHNGGSLGVEYNFTASVSLDSHPMKIRKMAQDADLELTSFCAHANLLDPPAPDRYGTVEIIKAIRLASLLGIKQVITTEGDPKTEFGHNLSHEQRLFAISEKLYEPIRWAEELEIDLLLEPHGILTDTADTMGELLDYLGHEDTVGINLDTGNSWLGGGEPLEFVQRYASRIKHVHWKDMEEAWLPKRGTVYGCGMGMIPLGDGIVGIREVVDALLESGFDGPTTLEVAGKDNMLKSAERLREWSS